MAIMGDIALEDVLPELINLRHTIHSQPDLSGHEATTATRLLDYLLPFQPEQVHEGLGCHGLCS
jgi:metal-dependent amidase/aminoacylase/carboxypeptidase family protein